MIAQDRQGPGPATRTSSPAAGDGRWSLLPCFLIRSTGFAVELLDALRMPESQRHCREILATRARIDDLRAAFDTRLFPDALDHEQQRGAEAAVFGRWYKLNRGVFRGQPCPAELQDCLAGRIAAMGAWIEDWNTALAAADRAQEEFERVCEAELAAARACLHATVRDERFQEALLLSNPNMYTVAVPSYLRHYDPCRRSAKARQLERRLYAYLQRFCAKNDTTSFFGPIDYGWYDPQRAEALTVERLPGGDLSHRLARLSYWAAQALADTIAAEESVLPYLVPRLQHGCTLLPSGDIDLTARQARVRVSREPLTVLRRIDGVRRAGEVCAAPGDGSWRALRRLSDQGLVLWRLDIPTAVFDPLAWLCTWVEHLPATCPARVTWLQRLAGLKEALAQFSAAPPARKLALLQQLEATFNALTGQAPRRGEGAIYADRQLLYDEAQGDIATCTVGRPLQADLLARLQPTLDLCASYGVLLQQACQRRAQEVFLEMGGGEPQPYLAFVRRLDSLVRLEECVADPTVQDFLDRLGALARARLRDGRVQLAADDVQPFLQPVPAGSMVSPDLFMAAPSLAALEAGDYHPVVGEIHYGAQVWCHFLTFCGRQDDLAAALAAALPAGPEAPARAALVHRRNQGKTFYLELPGLSVDVLGRSCKPRGGVLPVADLEVGTGPSGLILRSRSRGHRLELYPRDPRSVSNWLFGTPPVIAPPLRLDWHTPRIELHGVVVQRARWELPVADLIPPRAGTEGAALMLHAAALQRRYGLPDRCFARVPEERKPFFVDFASLLSLEHFFSLIGNSVTVTLSEMLPDTGAWWLQGPAGTRSCEWRMTLIYGAADAGADGPRDG